MTNILSPQITGVELPPAGRGTFQALFFVAPQVTGSRESSATPSLFGPRDEGQLVASALAAGTKRKEPRRGGMLSVTTYFNKQLIAVFEE